MTYTEPQNLTGLSDIFSYANNVTEQVFGIGLLISFYLIVFINLSIKGEQAIDAMLVAGFVTTIMAMILLLLGIITGYTFFVCVILYGLSAIFTNLIKSG